MLPIVADAGEHTQHLVQVGGHGVPPPLVRLLAAGRLLHPGCRRVVAQRAEVSFHQLQLQLPHEGAELPHEELQLGRLIGTGAVTAAAAAYPQFELGPQRGVEQALPPAGTHGRGPELVPVGQEGEDVDDELAG